MVQKENSITTVRVRGIYATALAILLLKQGFQIVDPSNVLKERLKLKDQKAPAEVTIKTLEERQDTLLVFGYPWEKAEKIFNYLSEWLDLVFKAKSLLGNNTVVAAVVTSISDGFAHIKLPDGRLSKVSLGSSNVKKGDIIKVSIVHDSPYGKPVAKNEIRVVGDYVILSYPGSGVSFSEYIRDPDRKADLLMIAGFNIDLEKYHVHFRSNSKNINEKIIENEINNLLNELEKINELSITKPQIIRRGEFLGFITLSRPAKEKLDKIRSEVITTIQWHHSLKSFGHKDSSMVECMEDVIQSSGIKDIHGIHIAKHLISTSRHVTIDHMRPDGKVYRLGPFLIKDIIINNNNLIINLEREFRRTGILDGLNLEFEPGDYSITRIDTSKWFLIHEYYTKEGDLLGVYGNINTPVEIGSTGLKYLDLLVDVIYKSGGEPEIIDREELEDLYTRGFISENLYKKALETVNELINVIKNNYKDI